MHTLSSEVDADDAEFATLIYIFSIASSGSGGHEGWIVIGCLTISDIVSLVPPKCAEKLFYKVI